MRMEQVELTNMCMVISGNRVLVEEKRGRGYKGIVFPGGHVEMHEPIVDSVIREMYEETGLTIRNPQLCGIKNWVQKDGSRYIVFLFKTNDFDGEICSSDEGEVFWTDFDQIHELNLMWNMEEILQIMCTDNCSEYYFDTRVETAPGILK